MDILSSIGAWLGSLPAWGLLLPPALILVFFVPLFFLRKRGAFVWCALVLVCAEGILAGENVWAAPTCGLIGLLLYPLFLLPRREKGMREEKLRERFLEEAAPLRAERERPPKVCCFEEPQGETAEERGIRLSHALSMLEKLKKEKLSPADRLELELLTHSVQGAAERPLSEAGADALSDTLSAVLRLAAKYS